MASDTFLGLVNRVLNDLNEVELDTASFTSTVGFHTAVKTYVNQGLFDVYAHEGVEWPFLFSSTSFNTEVGVIDYARPANIIKGAVDWNSFKILRGACVLSSLTQTGGVATAVSTTAHNFKTGDFVCVYNADQSEYNIESVGITVVDSTTFTFAVSPSAVSPATTTSSIKVKSNTVMYKRLAFIDADEYMNTYAEIMENYNPSSYNTPSFVAKDKTGDYIIFPASDRVYTVAYDAFIMPDKLVDHDDTHNIPEQWEQAIVDFALYRAYMFRDNMEQAKIAEDTGLRLVRQMRKALMPVQANINWS